MTTKIFCAGLFALSLATGAFAQETPVPPPNAVKLSQIVAEIEARDGFKYIDEVDWDDDGYVVTYYTADKAKVEIRYDPATGKPK